MSQSTGWFSLSLNLAIPQSEKGSLFFKLFSNLFLLFSSLNLGLSFHFWEFWSLLAVKIQETKCWIAKKLEDNEEILFQCLHSLVVMECSPSLKKKKAEDLTVFRPEDTHRHFFSPLFEIKPKILTISIIGKIREANLYKKPQSSKNSF